MVDTHYRKILIATDGSENSMNAISTGIDFAQKTGADVYAVHVITTGSYYITPNFFGVEKDNIKKSTTDYVEIVGNAKGIEVKSFILEGDPAEKIIDFARENNINLVVMGTLGKSGIERFLIGSVSEKVIRNSDSEVLIVP